ncbi:hypothetical protein [Bradyrhizobium sp. 195]|uniref:hypothetical protein n=1 Tax=Bradyrhizobium sp. 195 TaxID=2782662 RepID=UPI002000FD96|nr:hypothetical protein [Bradyrhizobium sp. 195]UPK24205.1 hypothetical protein IVB26_22825 [Bradyrhizobium sp. 195]
MFPNRRPAILHRLRHWRGLLAVLVAVTYLFAGAAHGLCDIDVTSPSGGSEIASFVDDGSAGHGDHKALAGHHCHGCFSVAIAQPLHSATTAGVIAAPVAQRQPMLVGIAPDTTSPPPKPIA